MDVPPGSKCNKRRASRFGPGEPPEPHYCMPLREKRRKELRPTPSPQRSFFGSFVLPQSHRAARSSGFVRHPLCTSAPLDALRCQSDPSGGALCPTQPLRTGTGSTARPFAGASARSAWTVRTTGRAVFRGRPSVPSTSTSPGSWTRSWMCATGRTTPTRRRSRRRSAAPAPTATAWACAASVRRPLHRQHLPAPRHRGSRRGRAAGVVPAPRAAATAICLRSKAPESPFLLAPGADGLYPESGQDGGAFALPHRALRDRGPGRRRSKPLRALRTGARAWVLLGRGLGERGKP